LIQKIHFISQIALFGSIGAFLSVCIGIKQLELNDFSIPWHNFIWGVVRIIIGIIGAIILFFGIKSKLIFSPFSEASSSKELIFFLCALAGFSESLVPNSLRKIEKTMDQNKTK
jgi:hypothetical protein